MKKSTNHIIIVSLLVLFSSTFFAQRKFEELKKFDIPEARQGVAVDENYFYAVDTRGIAKYDKSTGELVKKWEGEKECPIKHLDSGVIFDGKLYTAHSNYPEFPMTSSIEIWDTETLEHIGTHSFGIEWGSCTWVDRNDGYWWAAFAHYNKWSDSTGTDVRWTTVIKFDDEWRKLEAWVFPKEVLKNFENMSNSGGSWGVDGLLYCTGHDRGEVYVMRMPKQGSILELVETVPVNCTGQGIAWDRSESATLYTIRKAERQIICSKMKM
ncbi:MAG: hypothetical protein PVH88_26305 [Ignavibacteria bacterium]|jgi:hypothetical protein